MNLQTLLKQHGIAQAELGKAITQSSGKPLGKSATSLLLRKGEFPKNTPRSAIELQIRDFLTEKGIKAVPPDLFGDNDGTADPQIEPEVKPMITQSAMQHFQLFRDPFTNDVKILNDIFWSQEQYYIRAAMKSTALHGGILAIIGESGAGKSTIRTDLEITAEQEKWPVVFITPLFPRKKKLTGDIIDRAILRELSTISYSKLSKLNASTRFDMACDALLNCHKERIKPVLFMEEAHDLPDDTFKELKQYRELRSNYESVLSIILVGQPELKARLNLQRNYKIREFITRCEIAELLPLGKDIKPYLQLKFARIGRKLEDFFAEDAFDAMREKLTDSGRGGRVSTSYPQKVNHLVILCLNEAVELGEQLVNADVVKVVKGV